MRLFLIFVLFLGAIRAQSTCQGCEQSSSSLVTGPGVTSIVYWMDPITDSNGMCQHTGFPIMGCGQIKACHVRGRIHFETTTTVYTHKSGENCGDVVYGPGTWDIFLDYQPNCNTSATWKLYGSLQDCQDETNSLAGIQIRCESCYTINWGER